MNLSRHCGIVCSQPFEKTKRHRLEDLQINTEGGEERAKGQIEWLLAKGEAIFPDADEPRHEKLVISRRFRVQDCIPGKFSRVVFATCSVDTRPNRIPDLEQESK